MKSQLADIALDESRKLNGFRVGGLFPFYLKHIKTRTHIRLCEIQERINQVSDSKDLLSDFYNPTVQAHILPLIEEYILVALLNNRRGKWLIRPFLRKKIARCGHKQLCNLYFTIQQLNEPAFFLAYYKRLKQTTGILLREDVQS